ncbi:MAG: hypothetical protein AAF206_04725 [Bacteroidota bacterium]
MLEIIMIFFLSRKLRDSAEARGESKGKWTAYMVLAWFGIEIAVVVTMIMTLGEDVTLVAGLVGIAGGFLGYYLVKSRLEALPLAAENQFDLIDQIGQSEEDEEAL